jgi:hypothetical protein
VPDRLSSGRPVLVSAELCYPAVPPFGTPTPCRRRRTREGQATSLGLVIDDGRPGHGRAVVQSGRQAKPRHDNWTRYARPSTREAAALTLPGLPS